MKRFILIALLASSSAALAQSGPQEPIKLSISSQDLNVIGQALGQMPYNVAAPVLNRLQQEVQQAAKTEPKLSPEADKPK